MDPQVTIEEENFGSRRHGQRLATLRTIVVTSLLYLIIPVIFSVASDRLTHAKRQKYIFRVFCIPLDPWPNPSVTFENDTWIFLRHPGPTLDPPALVLGVSS